MAGRPTPDYLPEELVNQAASLGYKPKAYAKSLGLHENRFYGFFGSPHSKLKPYLQICQATSITVEELAEIISSGEFETFVNTRLLPATETSGIRACAKKIGISFDFIYDRINSPALNGLSAYIEMAQILGWDLDKLVQICYL